MMVLMSQKITDLCGMQLAMIRQIVIVLVNGPNPSLVSYLMTMIVWFPTIMMYRYDYVLSAINYANLHKNESQNVWQTLLDTRSNNLWFHHF